MSLFDPLELGSLTVPNRVFMAPLTRCRAGEGRVPTDLMADYYRQRSSAGLIFSEATSVSPMGVGYPNTPGIWSAEQTEGWKKVTEAVHGAGGRIQLQLWHVGRISDPIYLDGKLPVAPSAVAAAGHVSLVRPEKAFVTPHPLSVGEIRQVVEDFRKGAENAKAAGFDGVLVHSANGYLIDQFLQDSTNRRDDLYGGSIENRARLLMEIVDAVTSVWDPGRVGVHLAPRGDAHDMGDSDPEALFTYVARELAKRSVGYISAREHHQEPALGPAIKAAFGGPFVANESFDKAGAEKVIDAGDADAVAFGKDYIANPDLPERFRQDAPLNEPDPSTFYFSGEGDIRHGYTDYPFLEPETSGA
ncbi:2,4-dienoyl-CoA reductase or related NADH-dependent reductase [Haloferula helveola]|uniref:2,4-dienoyl-CoA reductase or related NADH-dependent reductase n=1 Tax=Haloferula helveola TaxID=490095 RepID=A0ABN6H5M3_9BACT|nr:2,4-dienoyl-CoA reductase or related NADH-dependent reductase [Haloferula helveola]